MPDGDAIIVIWLQILCLAGSLNENGLMYFSKDIPFTDEMLATEFDRPISTIRLALATFEKFKMIEIVDDVLLVSNWEKYQSADKLEKIREQNKLRQQRFREKQKQLSQSNVTETLQITQRNGTDIDIDKELDKDIDKDKDTIVLDVPETPYKEIAELYNGICISFNPIKQITDKRKGNMNARYKESKCNIEVFKILFTKMQESNFLKGGWDSGGKADFDWVMKPTNFVKVLEGKYDNNKNQKKQQQKQSNLTDLLNMIEEGVFDE